MTITTSSPGSGVGPRRLSSWVLDVAVVLLVAAVSVPTMFFNSAPVTRTVPLTVLLLLPLLVRRLHPVHVFGFLAAVAFVQWALDVQLAADIGLLVALYTVAAQTTVRWTVAAVATLEVGVALVSARTTTHNAWTTAVLFTGMVVAATALGVWTNTRRAFLTELRDRAARLERERDQQGALAAGAERARIAREMHDIVAHHLTVIVALSEGAQAAARSDPQRALDVMQTVSATGRQALTDTRRLLGVLRQDGLVSGSLTSETLVPQPDLGRLDELLDTVRHAGLAVTLTVRGSTDGVPVPAGVQLTLYRLVQEALTNTMKHGGPAARAEVRITYRPDRVSVDVLDDGLGSSAVGAGTGHGLIGMRERLAASGGHVESGPRDAFGWRVHAHVDLDGVPAPVDRVAT